MADAGPPVLVDARPIEHPTARRRGIGRYTAGLIQGLAEVGATVTALAAHPDEAALIRPQLPGIDVAVWDPAVVRASPDAWYVATGLFLHPISFDPIPAPVTRAGLPVAGILYDVIPYRYPERYLVEPSARRMAELRKPLARTVDVALAISEFAASTSIEQLGLVPSRVRMIGAGVEPRFEPPVPGRPRPDDVPAEPYVVCVTGADEHKNTIGLIDAWGLLPGSLRDRHRLVIVGAAGAAVRGRWERRVQRAGVSASVELTGPVTDERLVHLLQHAELSVTPSFEEGFGLPVLEAAACGTAVISSDRGALPEVLAEPQSCFDPAEPGTIAAAIERALADERHRAVLLAAGRRAVERWTWPQVASGALDAIQSVGASRTRLGPQPRVLLVYGVEQSETGRRVAAAMAALPGRPAVWEAVDLAGTSSGSEPTAERSPAAGIGRYPKPHDFDRVVVLGDATVPGEVATAVRLLPPFDVAKVADLLAVPPSTAAATAARSGERSP